MEDNQLLLIRKINFRKNLEGVKKMANEKNFQILAEHYQKTFEVAYELWKQRNKLYFGLLGLIGVSVLLTFQAPQANSLLIDWIARLLGVTDPNRLNELRNGFPFAILHGVLGLAIFYLLIILYQYHRLYLHDIAYLRVLETEIKTFLDPDSRFFTRESIDYTGGYKPGFLIAWTYVVTLGLLLLAYFGGRVADDIRTQNLFLMIVDIVLLLLTSVYFVLYTKEST
jgi:hypothetical protein